MNSRLLQPAKAGRSTLAPPMHGLLQRKCACGAHTPGGGACENCAGEKKGLQRKLTIGSSDDPLEHEADRVADQVMSQSPARSVTAMPVRVQRAALHASGPSAEIPASVTRTLAASGAPLEPAMREDMEQRFGHDFSQVRIHDGSGAAQSARDVGARAYTVGSNIVFGAGQLNPTSAAGGRLLAHELTHLIQQGAGAQPSLQLKPEDAATQCGGTWTCAASPCDKPDPGREDDGKAATAWTLKVMIDAEAESAEKVTAGTVGHTYIEFSDSSGATYTYGFYPDKSVGTPDPVFRPAVAGCVVHPDTNHKGCVDYTESFELPKVSYDKALSFAQLYCSAPDKYNVLTNNCVTFAQTVAGIAGRTLPAVRGKVGGSGLLSATADNPYTLIEGLRRRDAGPTYNLTSDSEIRAAVASAKPAELEAMPTAERVRILTRLLEGWVAEEDMQAIETVCKRTTDFSARTELQVKIGPLGDTLFDAEFQKRLKRALFTLGPGDFVKPKTKEGAG